VGAGQLGLLLLLVVAAVYGASQYLGPDSASANGPGPRGRGGTPVLLMFTADWCVPCQQFKARVLHHPLVSERIDRSVRFQTVDLTVWRGQAARTATEYGVRAVPTLILTDPDGNEISRYDGAHDPDWFLKWLERNVR
jgi:thiol:disulfide interchange protein